MRPVRGIPGADFAVEDVRGAFPDEIEIKSINRPVDATVRVPGSKSITNRVLLIAALADGASTTENPLFSDDSYWLMDALVRLGFRVRADRDAGTATLGGQGGIRPRNEAKVFVGNAGEVFAAGPGFGGGTLHGGWGGEDAGATGRGPRRGHALSGG